MNDKNVNSLIKKETNLVLFDSLYQIAKKITNTEVLFLISSCYKYIAKDNRDKSYDLLVETLGRFKTENSSLFNIGELYIIAGLLKYFGINTYKLLNVHEMIFENMRKNKNSFEKQNAISLIKVFSDALKRLFEPY